jgi:thiamine pyrophosphate-dependent acetolactate synthase large subunit-like protein
MRVKVSDYIADFLVRNGITDMFTLTGGGAMHLNTLSVIRRGFTAFITTMSRPAP